MAAITPDIKAPKTGMPEWLLWLFGGIAIVSIVGVSAYLYKDTNDANNRRIAIQRGMPSDFFGFFGGGEEPTQKKEEAIASTGLTSIPVEESPEAIAAEKAKEEAKIKAAAKKAAKNRKADKPTPQPIRLTAAQLFDLSKQEEEARKRQIVAKLNAERRGTASVMISTGVGRFSTTKYDNTQKEWDEPQDMASYPVKLDRVWTVDKTASCILIEEIISDLEGKVRCQLEENVYGGHGRKVLIPAGTKAVGRYRPLKKVGDERLTISWERMITPDGINIHTGDAEMTDGMGRSGATGNVDRRYTERYGMALLFSTISAAAAYSVPVDSQNQQVIIENYSRDVLNLTNTILQEHINIKPRVTIPAGSRISISASRDVWFKEPKEKEVEATPLNEDKGAN